MNGLVVVTDGGSHDATCDIVSRRAAAEPLIRLIDKPGRLQSAGVNLAVDRFGTGAEWLLRLDAHSDYPPITATLCWLRRSGPVADSVVVTMHARARGFCSRSSPRRRIRAWAMAGRPHRLAGGGAWVDHGHHA